MRVDMASRKSLQNHFRSSRNSIGNRDSYRITLPATMFWTFARATENRKETLKNRAKWGFSASYYLFISANRFTLSLGAHVHSGGTRTMGMTSIYGGNFRMTQQRISMNAPRPVNNNEAYEDGLAVKVKVKTKKPAMYKVLLLNDDFTPMEFVVYVLERVFRKSRIEANDIMLKVHN